VNVSSLALIRYAQEKGALYLDTCIEPWEGGYTDASKSAADRTNYALRELALQLKQENPQGPTAMIAHGANPGLVSHFVKEALLNIAEDTGFVCEKPQTKQAWANLAQNLGIKTIHIAERDTQQSSVRKSPQEFVNTWSVDGFISEGLQPAELGWGTHEKHWPHDANAQETGCRAAIYLNRPGAATRVRSWVPGVGAYQGFLITHNEAISIADYLTVHKNNVPSYRPTVHYAYYPCDDAVLSLFELCGNDWQQQASQRILQDEIISGSDALGVLLMGHAKNAYWYGSRLSIEQARSLAPHTNATGLQVTATIVAAMQYAIQNPNLGVVEADEIPYDAILPIAKPYLGEVFGAYTDWTPLQSRESLFDDSVDKTCPYQFKNFRIE